MDKLIAAVEADRRPRLRLAGVGNGAHRGGHSRASARTWTKPTSRPKRGIESRAISYSKGCYIGQEVIARIRTYGQVNKALRGLRLADDLRELPKKGDKLFLGEKEVGYTTSALASPALNANIALGYVRKEANQIGSELAWHTASGDSHVKVIELPFRASHG